MVGIFIVWRLIKIREGITRVKWKEEEKELLFDCYSTHYVDEILYLFPERSKNSIILMAEKLGLDNAYNRKYTEKDNLFITENYLELSDKEIAKVLNRAPQSIKEHRRKLGLKRPQLKGTYEDVNEFLRKNNKIWKRESMIKCGYKCIITGGKFKAIHHLYGMNLIIDKTLKNINFNDNIDINNLNSDEKELLLNAFLKEQSKYPLGVCLCDEIHKDFHNKYGYGNNTPEQFDEYISLLTHKRDIA